MAEPTDPELLEGWRKGDMRCGEKLAARYFMAVRAYFLNKAPAAHEDLVQETFVRLSSKRDSFAGRSTFRVFVFGVARMVLLEYLRAKQRAARFNPMEHSVADTEGGRMSSLMARDESHRIVLDALRELPLADQELLELYYWQQLTAKEIAALQGLPEPTVRSRIRSALKRTGKAFAALREAPAAEPAAEETLEGWLGELRSELAGLKVSYG